MAITTSRRIEVVEYDQNWPKLFTQEQELLQHALGKLALSIDHIGSTAVEGLAAMPRKPVTRARVNLIKNLLTYSVNLLAIKLCCSAISLIELEKPTQVS